MHRFFINEVVSNNQNQIVIDDKNDVNHISHSLRVKIEEKLEICDLDEKEYIVKVKIIETDKIICEIIKSYLINRESNINIDLYQGLAKGSKMDTIIQKSVELGVNAIVPMITKRAIVKLDKKSELKKIERWQKISDEAAKQSKRSHIPEIRNVFNIKNIKNIIDKYDLMIILYELESTMKLKKIIIENKYKNIAIFIGPEGGFEEEEVRLAVELGVFSITLGKRILRTETAGIACISILQYELGDIGN